MEEPLNPFALSRRRFLQVTAFGLGGAAVLGACGGDDDDGASPADTTAGGSSPATTTATTSGGSGGGGSSGGDIPPIKIGYVTPRSGVLAAFGEADDFVLAAMASVLGGNVEIIARDAESDSAKAGEVTQDLINQGVHLILAGGTPDISVPVAATCELGEMPCLTTQCPWQPHYLGTGGKLGPDITPGVAAKFNYHFFWGLEDVIEQFLAMWDASGVDKNVGALWGTDPDGLAWSDAGVGFPPALEAAGYSLVDPGRFDLSTQDYSALINQLKDANVSIVSGNMPPPVFATFQAQALQQGLNAPVVTLGKALLFPSAVESFPKGEGLTTEVWWGKNHPFTSSLTGETCTDLATAFETATNAQWTQPLGFGHAIFEVAIDAVKRAGSTDKQALLDALAATNLDTIAGTVNFANGPVPQFTKTPLVGGQWVKGQTYPYELAIRVNSQLPDLPVDGDMQLIK